MYETVPKRIHNKMSQRNDNKNRRAQTFGTNGHFNNTGSSKNNQSTQPLESPIHLTMLSLFGVGPHDKKCATPLNYSKGGVSMSLPPKIKEIKEKTGISTNSTQTDSITLKAIREEYHNPDPIAQLVGKVNETHVS